MKELRKRAATMARLAVMLFAVVVSGCGPSSSGSGGYAGGGPNEATTLLNDLLRKQFPEGQPANLGQTDPTVIIDSTNGRQTAGPSVLMNGQSLPVAIGYKSTVPVDAICIGFGSPADAWCVPTTSANVDTSGTTTSGAALLAIAIPPDLCDQLGSICHDIICYEFARTTAGTFSQANINQLASACGGCDEPSCQSLLTDCEAACVVDTDCGSSDQICANGVCVREGALRFTLTWSAATDLDLYVLTPDGVELSFNSPMGGGGNLDHDDQDGGTSAVENVFFDAPAVGKYTYWVHNYDGMVPATFSVEVFRNGVSVAKQSGSLPAADIISSQYTVQVQ